jgi:hypothetical protein
MPTIATLPALADLAEDVRAAAWLLREDNALRGYLDMVASLPPEGDAWVEVLSPWLDAARRGEAPRIEERAEIAAVGALGVAALRASREAAEGPELAAVLRCAARWCFFVVRPGTS